MSIQISARPAVGIVAAAVLMLGAGQALAGSCPPEKVLKNPRSIESKDSVGVTRETLSTVNLKGWRSVGDLFLRTRRLTIAGRLRSIAKYDVNFRHVEAAQLDFKTFINKSLQLYGEIFLVPACLLRQPIVGKYVSPLLSSGEVRELNRWNPG